MNLEEISFRNLVIWHKDDLIRIMSGTLTSNLFTASHRARLIKQGILHRIPTRRTLPTPKAIEILGLKEYDDQRDYEEAFREEI